MIKFGRLSAAVVLVSASVVACAAPAPAKPVYCGLSKATKVVSASSPLIVNGTPGNDVIAITGGVHEVFGGAGNDTICADAAGSSLYGGDGNDWLIGGAGRDRLDGGNGNDLLQGGPGADTLIGGPGTDTVTYADHTTPVTASPDGKADNGSAGEDDLIDPSVENLTGGSGNDTLTGTAGANVLIGGAGNDRLLGASGNDVLEGQAGNDDLVGMGGSDTKSGGTGSNYCDQDPSDPTAAACQYDPNAPTIQSITMTTPQLDFRLDQRRVAWEIHATDLGGGIWTMVASFCGPDGQADGTTDWYMVPESGTPTDGTWMSNMQLPDDAMSGTWSICAVHILDTNASYVTYSSNPALGSDDRPMPAGNTFVVANDGNDHVAPVISDISCTPSVDVTVQDATVACDFTVIDQGDGLADIYLNMRHFDDANTQSHTVTTYPGWLDTGNPQLVTPDSSGDAGSGRYHATVVIPTGSAAGGWDAAFAASDKAYNRTDTSVPVTVVDGNPIDSSDVPALIDGQASVSSSKLTVSLHLQSTRDQASIVSVSVTNPANAVEGFDLDLSSGTDLDGVWQGTLTLPSGEPGDWSVSGVGVIDKLGVVHTIPDDGLAKMTGLTWTMS